MISAVEFFSSTIGRLPGKMSCASNEYLSILRLDAYTSDSAVGGSNAGFVKMMKEKYSNSKCFRVALDKFYQDVDSADGQTLQRRQLLTSQQVPAFNTSVESMNNPAYQPGWLFDLAMRRSSNDPQMALALIAYCGHDDVRQTDESEVGTTVECPGKDSLMFFAGSLFSQGKDQRPIAGQMALESSRGVDQLTPTKYYHLMMGAYVGCRLVEKCGLSELEASQFERKAALIYRAFRLISEKRKLSSQHGEAFTRYLNDLSKGRIPEGKRPFDVLVDHLADAMKKRRPNPESNESKGTTFESKIRERAVKDAERLLTLNLVQEGLLKNSLSLLGEVQLKEIKMDVEFGKRSAPYDFVSAGSAGVKNSCGKISPDRCEVLLKNLKSINADLVWTANQHSMGAKFGAEKCKDAKVKRAGMPPPICKAYEAEPDITPSTVSHRKNSESGNLKSSEQVLDGTSSPAVK